MTTTELPTVTHSDRLKAAADRTAAARHEIEQHDALAAEVDRLKTSAAEGMLDDKQALDLVAKAERVRVGEITRPRRQRALDDALAHEVKVGLEVLAALSDALDPLEKDAADAADKLTEVLVDPAAAALPEDAMLPREVGIARCAIEKAMPGVYGAFVLRDRIRAASQTTWGSSHVAAEAREIVANFDHEVGAIRSGINGLLAVHKAAAKVFG